MKYFLFLAAMLLPLAAHAQQAPAFSPAQQMVGQLATALAAAQDREQADQQRIADLMKQVAELTKERDDLKAKNAGKP